MRAPLQHHGGCKDALTVFFRSHCALEKMKQRSGNAVWCEGGFKQGVVFFFKQNNGDIFLASSKITFVVLLIEASQ